MPESAGGLFSSRLHWASGQRGGGKAPTRAQLGQMWGPGLRGVRPPPQLRDSVSLLPLP